ncbi:MAG: YitT family protein [Acetatifactor sp.]|nr:YitT family protein [Acetatifactor sp.]
MKNLSRDIKRIILCVIAGVVFSLNIRTFVHTGGLLPGGFAGVTLLLQQVSEQFFHFKLPYGPIYILMNLFPIVLSYRKIGKKYTVYSCITIGLIAVLTDLIPPNIITQDVLLISVFGGIINGLATMLCLNAGATSGGTDFIAIFISERFKVDAWNYILIFNAIVLICDGFLFGWDKALYSIIFQFVSTQVLSARYKRYKKDTLFIITDHPQEIAKVINEKTGHGATEIDVLGTYQETPRRMIYSVINAEELRSVLRDIAEIDPKAFVNVMRTDRLMGRFYMRPND